ncbi:alpha/beta hydrolase [Paenibacillus sp. sptzw28]|uniref:alpha/beta fold hydrolase n=1 Tax=Paenibacillus sp. sptzw28 TaxID=715179 RepID=UPI001C6F2478|nr:alpha/beta hydrolase [Paenibacillus sp. sptzw28]QYR19471.1 alpha/beta hydrolase [Paenibacillus sp. sptzw28]
MNQIQAGKIKVNGTELYYESLGSGEAVVLLHGHSVDRRMWDPQFEALAAKYRVIRYDMRGYGLSSMPVEDEPFLHADDLYSLMKELGVTTAHLVGLSMGSFTALDFLALHPECVSSVSVASGAIYYEDDEDHQSSAKPGDKSGVDVEQHKRIWFGQMQEACGPHWMEIKNTLWEMISEWSAWQANHREARTFIGPSLGGLLRSLPRNVPLLVIIGMSDNAGSLRSSDKLLRLMPSARPVYLPDSGHFSNMETPELFTKELTRFLDSV